MNPFLMVLMVAILGVVGDLLINQWAKTNQIHWLAWSVPVWVVLATIFGLLLRQKHYTLGIAVLVILLLHSGFILIWDVVVEGSVLTPTQWAGVVAAMIAIVLMEIGKN